MTNQNEDGTGYHNLIAWYTVDTLKNVETSQQTSERWREKFCEINCKVPTARKLLLCYLEELLSLSEYSWNQLNFVSVIRQR